MSQHLLPLAWALTLGGVVLVVLSIIAIRYLKTPQHGISYEPIDESLNWESMVITQALNTQPSHLPNDLSFGGGQAGGGGAERRIRFVVGCLGLVRSTVYVRPKIKNFKVSVTFPFSLSFQFKIERTPLRFCLEFSI